MPVTRLRRCILDCVQAQRRPRAIWSAPRAVLTLDQTPKHPSGNPGVLRKPQPGPMQRVKHPAQWMHPANLPAAGQPRRGVHVVGREHPPRPARRYCRVQTSLAARPGPAPGRQTPNSRSSRNGAGPSRHMARHIWRGETVPVHFNWPGSAPASRPQRLIRHCPSVLAG